MECFMETANIDFAETLGFRKKMSDIAIVEKIERGLSVATVDRVASLIRPGDATFKFTIIPKATLSRRQTSKKLSIDEGDRVVRLARIMVAAIDTWGDPDNARAFLQRPHAMLDGKTPLDIALHTAAGARLVEDILARLKYGSAA